MQCFTTVNHSDALVMMMMVCRWNTRKKDNNREDQRRKEEKNIKEGRKEGKERKGKKISQRCL